MVTHDREEAMIMADKIVVLNNHGEIAQKGSPEEVFNNPNSEFIAEFMGAENILSLKVKMDDSFLIIKAGPYNEQTRINQEYIPQSLRKDGMLKSHFRSETAKLVQPDTEISEGLLMKGIVTQVTYPGGFFRHAVSVGNLTFLVDHEHRIETGEVSGIFLEPEDLHLFEG